MTKGVCSASTLTVARSLTGSDNAGSLLGSIWLVAPEPANDAQRVCRRASLPPDHRDQVPVNPPDVVQTGFNISSFAEISLDDSYPINKYLDIYPALSSKRSSPPEVSRTNEQGEQATKYHKHGSVLTYYNRYVCPGEYKPLSISTSWFDHHRLNLRLQQIAMVALGTSCLST